jgi:Mycothiol maleylpyruvate isomerase N-terminal domain
VSRPAAAAAGAPELVTEALRAEAERLSEVARAQDRASFARPSPCPPWTVGELFYHVRIALGRVAKALAETEPAPAPGSGPGGLISAAGYYRDDHRFSAAGNADRITLAQQGAASLRPASLGAASLGAASLGAASLGPASLGPADTGTAAALARDFDQAWLQTWSLVQATPPDRVVRTRHGDYMLLTEFLRTRVVEVAVHGLDLAAGLGRDPWLTDQAAGVIEELLVPAPAAAGLRRDLGWDQVTLIAKGTGRLPLTAAEAGQFQRRGGRRLFLG